MMDEFEKKLFDLAGERDIEVPPGFEERLEDSISRAREAERLREPGRSRGSRRRLWLVRAAVAAATVGALTVTAVAAGRYLGGWHGEEGNWVITNDVDLGLLVEDDTPDTTDNLVSLPSLYMAERVTVEDGRVILTLRIFRGEDTTVNHVLDITDDLAASPEGTYSFYEKDRRGDTQWEYDIVVKPGWDDETAEERGDGYGYIITGQSTASFHWYRANEMERLGISGAGATLTLDEPSWNRSIGAWNGEAFNVPQTWERDLG